MTDDTENPAYPVIVVHLDDGHGLAVCNGRPHRAVGDEYPQFARGLCSGCRLSDKIRELQDAAHALRGRLWEAGQALATADAEIRALRYELTAHQDGRRDGRSV